MLNVDELDPDFDDFLGRCLESGCLWAVRAVERELPRFLRSVDPEEDAIRISGSHRVLHFRWSGWFGAPIGAELHVLLEVDVSRGRSGYVTVFHGRITESQTYGAARENALAATAERRLGLS